MIPLWIIISICVIYLVILFWIAYYGDKKSLTKSIINNPLVYALSLTTYCTAWTFYGSVGKAATVGISFLATYLGPVILAPLWIILFKRIIRICRREKISSISDFIATRYGKDKFLGNLVTLMILLFIIPYISIQLRAIATSFDILIDHPNKDATSTPTALIIAIIMSIFVILFGTRNNRSIERNEGMVSVIAFEAMFKLIAFLAVGIYVTYVIFNGFDSIFSEASSKAMMSTINNIQNSLEGGYWDWFMLIALSFLVFTLLPRQFHLLAIENKDEKHVDQASWIFPLYLFAITLFILPIALGGKIYFENSGFNADSYILHFPMEAGNNLLATFVFLGGFAAATGMIIVETFAVSTMLANNILIPLLVNYLKLFSSTKVQAAILFCRRVSIPIVLFSAYFYMILIGEDYPLVEVGLLSFVGIVQLAPSFFGGLFWKRANKTGTIAGLSIGFILWFYTLLFPTLIRSGILGDEAILTQGLFELPLLKPYALLGLEGLNKISHGFFWSISANIFFYVAGSLLTVPKGIEIQQANRFYSTKIDGNDDRFRNRYQKVYFYELQELLITFLGPITVKNEILAYQNTYHKKFKNEDIVDIHFVDAMEKLLSDYIGNISARISISKLLKEVPLDRKEVIEILEETKDAITSSKLLAIKSDELEKTQNTLLTANKKLRTLDQLKNEFILTISHELRTPITSIRLLSEMLQTNPEKHEANKDIFLKTIIQESERLSALIDDTLLQEKLELGKTDWEFDHYAVSDLIQQAVKTITPLVEHSNIKITYKTDDYESFILADRMHLERVFLNILNNAIKFQDPEKDENLITIFNTRSNKTVTINIEDNGIGIAQNNFDEIFKTFVQLQNERLKVKPKGSGLGLSIVKKIVQKHKGSIIVESEMNKYTRFLITLPLNNNDENA